MLPYMDNYIRKIPIKKHAEILRLYENMSARALGKRFGVSHQAILNIVNYYGKARPVGANVRRVTAR